MCAWMISIIVLYWLLFVDVMLNPWKEFSNYHYSQITYSLVGLA